MRVGQGVLLAGSASGRSRGRFSKHIGAVGSAVRGRVQDADICTAAIIDHTKHVDMGSAVYHRHDLVVRSGGS